MHIHIHRHNHNDPAIEQKLDRILKLLVQNQEKLMFDLTQITSDVAADTNVLSSVQTLLASLNSQLAAALADPSRVDVPALQALQKQIEDNNAAFSAAVAANTPAAGQTPPAAAAQMAAVIDKAS